MSRLSVSSEPSMEEILASIRKIIAEDPAEPRAVAAPRPTASTKPALDRAMFLRDARAPAKNEGSETSSAAAPTITETATAAFGASELNGADRVSQPSTVGEPKSVVTATQASSAASLNTGLAFGTTTADQPGPQHPAMSVAAQLSDLLDDDLSQDGELHGASNGATSSIITTDVGGNAPAVNKFADHHADTHSGTRAAVHSASHAAVQAATLDAMAFAASAVANASSRGPAVDDRRDTVTNIATDKDADDTIDDDFSEVTPSLAARPGFSVSRDGYVPDDAPSFAPDHVSGAAASSDDNAPFVGNQTHVDVSKRPSSSGDAVHGAAFDQTAVSIPVSVISIAHTSPPTDAPASRTAAATKASASPFRMTNGSFADLQMSPQASAPRRHDVLQTPEPAVSLGSTAAKTTSPSVQATLPPVTPSTQHSVSAASVDGNRPKARFATGTDETIARVTKAVSDEATAAATAGFVAVQVLENPVMLDVIQAPQQVHPVAMRDFADVPRHHSGQSTTTASASSSLTVASEPPPPSSRTMEDTVADLLRPMLKSWLAENMPKIVERALRREISELEGPAHARAAE